MTREMMLDMRKSGLRNRLELSGPRERVRARVPKEGTVGGGRRSQWGQRVSLFTVTWGTAEGGRQRLLSRVGN